jgi:hypothetical protein
MMLDARADGTHLDASGHRLIVSNQTVNQSIIKLPENS